MGALGHLKAEVLVAPPLGQLWRNAGQVGVFLHTLTSP